MKVEFDNWETCDDESKFFVDMECLPRVGDDILIHKSIFPEHYFTGLFKDQPMEESHDGLVEVKATAVCHTIDDKGHMPRVCFDV